MLVKSVDVMPFNITAAVAKTKGLTLMPTYGLNVYSILKHNTLIMTTKSLDKIESKLLFYLHNAQSRGSQFDRK